MQECNQKIYKAECNGNDFVIILKHELVIDVNELNIQKLCNRKVGIGADGFILVDQSIDGYDFKMDYYNNDGSWETMCANGALCVLLVLEENKFKFDTYKFMAGDGEHQIRYNDNNLSIKMKSPSNKTQDVNIQGHTGAHIDSGAKHFVTCCDLRDTNQLFEIAKSIRYDSYFAPYGLNVNFLIVHNSNHINVITYEKGIEAIMLSCGSGSVAAAYYASQKEDISSPLKISNNGGDMVLEFNSDWTDVWLTSNPTITFQSEIDLETINLL